MVLVKLAYLADARNGISVVQMTAQRVTGIGRIHHDPAFTQHCRGLTDQARVGIIGVYREKLRHKIQISSRLLRCEQNSLLTYNPYAARRNFSRALHLGEL
jgi:hypothetical protein